MSPGEAYRLMLQLLDDSASHVFAAVAGWEMPLSQEGVILADIYDLTWVSYPRGRNRFKPRWRPWKQARDGRSFGNAGGRSREEVIAILNQHGHNNLEA